MRAEIDALYKRAKANLWVEDSETRTWLDAIWFGQTPAIQVLVARGRGGVDAVCKDAERLGYKHVFGLVDRDFGSSNHRSWSSMPSGERVYRLPFHEIENYLLSDVDALFGCSMHTTRRTRADVVKRILEHAKKRIWWVTCIRFLADAQRKSKEGYPQNPQFENIQSLTDAENHVLQSHWFTSTARACPTLADPATVTSELQAMYAAVEQEFVSDKWKEDFPGKEMFKEIAAYLNATNSGIDFIKSVGEWQRDCAKQHNKSLPLAALRTSIEDRVK